MHRVLIACALVVLGILPAIAMRGGRGGANRPCDAESLATARQIVADACDCDEASRHGQYVSGAARALHDAVKNGDLPRACKRLARRRAARSTCGKDGFVACCRPTPDGAPSCSIKREAKCQEPACASPQAIRAVSTRAPRAGAWRRRAAPS